MRTLKIGSIGPAVQLLQLALNRAGFGELEKDGIFGSATANAVRRFQLSRGIAADGVVGNQTHTALMPWYTGFLSYTVKSGDTFYLIARRFGISDVRLIAANPGVDPMNLAIGSKLIVPLAFPVVPTDIAWSSALVGYCVRGLAARYPFISAGELGKSIMGRPLRYMTLGTGANRVLYNASHHANEWITTPVLMKFAEELADAYLTGGEIGNHKASAILKYSSITLVPAVNPDGIDLVTGELFDGPYFTGAAEIANDYPSFSFPSGWKANIRGVDLNLQYPAGWEQARENKYALGITSPAPADFVGTAPLAAPEARAMYSFTLMTDPALTLSYHTQGAVIYWRYLDYDPPMARSIADAFSLLSGYAVEDTPYASAFAGYKDWFIQSYNRPGYTIEAGVGTNPLPITDFDRIYRDNVGILALGALVT